MLLSESRVLWTYIVGVAVHPVLHSNAPIVLSGPFSDA